ncbi:MAG: hypothetical protein KatS3mg108_0358 [Isosphaeraceae bacterium]|nr:MAG: hypothetical protein KatS3mg108_0358 [Isosphaeraceae bacterium]
MPPRVRGPLRLGLVALLVAPPGEGVPAGVAADPPRSRQIAGSLGGPYRHGVVRAEALGRGARSYWLYEPAEPTPEEPAPVVVFLHGWLAVNPGVYGAWIEHLTRSGCVVIYPRYQADWTTPPAEFLPNAASAIADALDVLATAPGRVRPDRSRVGLIGHSAGANLAVMLAAGRPDGLPQPRAVVAVMPGEVLPIDQPSPADLPAETRLLVVVGDRDAVVGDARARQIFAAATLIPPENKEYLYYRTQRHAPMPLVADHLAPTAALAGYDSGDGPFRLIQMARAGLDHLDRAGFWEAADLALRAGFEDLSLDQATDHGARLRQLGRGIPGIELLGPLNGDDLARLPRVAVPVVSWRQWEVLPRRTAASGSPGELQRR